MLLEVTFCNTVRIFYENAKDNDLSSVRLLGYTYVGKMESNSVKSRWALPIIY